MNIPEKLTQRLERIAAREGRTPTEVFETMLDNYETSDADAADIEAFIGAFDDDVTDMSTTVKETLRRKFADDSSS